MGEKRYISDELKHLINISHIGGIYYSDLGQDFISDSMLQDFWELIYVDRGCLHVETENETYSLGRGEVLFHEPMKSYKFVAEFTKNTSVCVISFRCNDEAIQELASKRILLNESLRMLLATIFECGNIIFSKMIEKEDAIYLKKAESAAGEQEQIFANYIENFVLFCLMELNKNDKEAESPMWEVSTLTKNHKEQLASRAIEYLIAHLTQTFAISDMCEELGCSKTTLSNAFKAYTGSSIIPYYNRLKIEAAKKMIRSDDISLTEISSRLNFCNLNYFSTAFKQHTGMYPSEYAKSIKVHQSVRLIKSNHDAFL